MIKKAACLGVLLLCACALVKKEPDHPLFRCWQSTLHGPNLMYRFEAERCLQYKDGVLKVIPVARYEADRIILDRFGSEEEAGYAFKGNILALQPPLLGKHFEPMEDVPPELVLEPMSFPDPDSLSPETVETLQKDLLERLKADQEVRKNFTDPNDKAALDKMAETDASNTAWLKETVTEHGWIDADRFGESASSAAFLLVQHSGDLPLMLAALPWIEKDVKARKLDGQAYALLFDRLHLRLGKRQRYGTQFKDNDKGETVLLPLEDPDKVDEYRKELGIFSLAKYIEFMESMLGKDVVVPGYEKPE